MTHAIQQDDLFTRPINKPRFDATPYLSNRKIKATFTANGIEHCVTGRQAQTILWLWTKEDSGITALEVSSWALRLSAYIHQLRALNLSIVTEDEAHDGGQHARYVLKTPIQIVKVEEK